MLQTVLGCEASQEHSGLIYHATVGKIRKVVERSKAEQDQDAESPSSGGQLRSWAHAIIAACDTLHPRVDQWLFVDPDRCGGHAVQSTTSVDSA